MISSSAYDEIIKSLIYFSRRTAAPAGRFDTFSWHKF